MPLVGLLSDSHGRAGTTQRAVEILIEQGAELLIHLGDVGSIEVIDALIDGVDSDGQLDPPVRLVFGNTDWDRMAMADYARNLGLAVDDPVGRITCNDKTLVFMHGHEDWKMQEALNQSVDYLCHGHTHIQSNQRQGQTRIINPGALFRAQTYTAALLDTDNDQVQFIIVK